MKVAPSARIPANKVMTRPSKGVLSYRSCTGGEASESLLLMVCFMRTFHFSERVAALSLVFAAIFPSSSTFALSVLPAQLKNTCVMATRSVQPIGDVVADVTIIHREVIERTGAAALADVPGVEIARNGGPRNSTSVFARVIECRHTIVPVEDGVRIDSKSTSGGADWQAIPLRQTDSIEIVRRSIRAIYGSDTVAGAIHIFTVKGQGAFALVISLGYQTINTYATAHHPLYMGLI